MSRTKMSEKPLTSPATRFVARLKKATFCPSALREPWKLELFASRPPLPTLTRVMVMLWTFCTNTSAATLVSLATRESAKLSNAT